MGFDLTGHEAKPNRIPNGVHNAVINDYTLGSKAGVGNQAEIQFEVPEFGRNAWIKPYVPDESFQGKDTQLGWSKDVWFKILTSVGAVPKVDDVKAVCEALKGRHVRIETRQREYEKMDGSVGIAYDIEDIMPPADDAPDEAGSGLEF